MRSLALVAVLAFVCYTQMVLAAEVADKNLMDCSKLNEVIDDLGSAQGLTVLNDKYPLASTAGEFSKRCEEMSSAIKTLKKYNRDCFSSLTQQVFSAILRTRAAMNEIHCKADSAESKEALASMKCLKENALEGVKEAEKKTILFSQVVHDSNISDEKLRLRYACCGVISGKQSFMGALNEKCSKYQKIYSDYVDSYTSEAMSLICPDAAKLDCAKLDPPKIENVTPASKFFLTPMLKLVKSLDH